MSFYGVFCKVNHVPLYYIPNTVWFFYTYCIYYIVTHVDKTTPKQDIKQSMIGLLMCLSDLFLFKWAVLCQNKQTFWCSTQVVAYVSTAFSPFCYLAQMPFLAAHVLLLTSSGSWRHCSALLYTKASAVLLRLCSLLYPDIISNLISEES